MSRPSLEIRQEQERLLEATNALKTHFELSNPKLRLVHNSIEFNKLDVEESGLDFEDTENRDPAVIAANLLAQTQFLRKLKYQYLEQNAKDRYVKSIVSDIDDAPIVTAEDIKELSVINDEKKAKLKEAKSALAETYNNIHTLTTLVQRDYDKTKAATDEAAILAQKILDARLALTRLRQTHPQPRLTITAADQKLADQVIEMQELSDQVEVIRKQVQAAKGELKAGTVKLENLRAERAETEKSAKNANVGEDDTRIAPLYDWFTASLTLHRSMQDIEEAKTISDNELRLTYKLEAHKILTITLIFLPDTRQLATVDITGCEGDFTELTETYIQANDVHGLINAVLARTRRT